MLSIFIEDKELIIKDIKINQLEKILYWLENDRYYRYAMGINDLITMGDLQENYLEALISENEFFSSINIEGEFIGFIKGRIDWHNERELWIMSILIDKAYQNMKIGKRTVNLVISFFLKKFCIKSIFSCLVSENLHGKAFWESLDFSHHKSLNNYFTVNGKSHDMIIMIKVL